MARNTSVTLGKHFDGFVETNVWEGRGGSSGEADRADLPLLEGQEVKLESLKATWLSREAELDQGLGVDGEVFMNDLING